MDGIPTGRLHWLAFRASTTSLVWWSRPVSTVLEAKAGVFEASLVYASGSRTARAT